MKSDQGLSSSVPKIVWVIGLSGLLINASTVMIFSFSAVYLKTILGVATFWVGLLEGVVEGTALVIKVFSGVISDYFRKRKTLVMTGYSLIALSRPILALSSSFSAVFLARVFDRLGNGIQATPRDALVGDVAPWATLGRSYALNQMLRAAGSFLGGCLAIGAMYLTNNNYHGVFWLASIPALFAVLLFAYYVKEPPLSSESSLKTSPRRFPLTKDSIKKLSGKYWFLMIIASIFMFARLSESFLILYAKEDFFLEDTYVPIVLILYNFTYSAASYPVGWLADRFNPYIILGSGIFVLMLTDGVLALSGSLAMASIGMALWGIQMAITQSIFLTLIAEQAPSEIRGTAFGIFYFISALSFLSASMIAGHIWDCLGGGRFVFGISGVVACCALVVMMFSFNHLKKPLEKTLKEN